MSDRAARATVWASVYTAVLSSTFHGTSMFKIDPHETRALAEREAKRALREWDYMIASEDEEANKVKR